MKIWIDAQLSPFLALYINNNFKDITAQSLLSLGLRDATDHEIFQKAREENVILMSKDQDFVKLLEFNGPPPKLIWITCGNTSNAAMCKILDKTLDQTISLLISGESIVQINNR